MPRHSLGSVPEPRAKAAKRSVGATWWWGWIGGVKISNLIWEVTNLKLLSKRNRQTNGDTLEALNSNKTNGRFYPWSWVRSRELTPFAEYFLWWKKGACRSDYSACSYIGWLEWDMSGRGKMMKSFWTSWGGYWTVDWWWWGCWLIVGFCWFLLVFYFHWFLLFLFLIFLFLIFLFHFKFLLF